MAARTVRMPAHSTRADTIEATVMSSPPAAREANDTQPTSSANPACRATIRRTRARPCARLAHTKLSTLEKAGAPLTSATARLTTKRGATPAKRSEEHTSELQSQSNLVCRLLLEKKKRTDHTERDSQ